MYHFFQCNTMFYFLHNKNKSGRLETEPFQAVVLLWKVLSKICVQRRVAKGCEYLSAHCEGSE